MILEGFIHYQTRQVFNLEPKEFDNVVFSPLGYVAESGFFKSPDNYFTILFGGNDENLKVHAHTNLDLGLEITSDIFRKILFDSSATKPHIGAWFDNYQKKVLLCRESFGSIPFFYIHIPGILFAFSTSITRLLQKRELKSYLEINRNRIISHCTDNLGEISDLSSNSFFSRVKSVPPGHLVTVTENTVVETPYLSLKLEKWDFLSSAADYGQAIKELLGKSVANVVNNGPKIIGSHLSGGLDSSSVSSVFRYLYPDRSLNTIHIHATHAEADESSYAQQVAESIRSKHYDIFQSHNDLEALILSTKLYGQPECSYLSPASNHKMLSYASQIGCDVLLNGHGGDSVIGNGNEVLGESFRQRNWEQLENFLRKRVEFFSLSGQYPNWERYSFEKKYNFVLQNFLYNRISELRSMETAELYTLYRDISKNLGISHSYFAKRALKGFLLRIAKRNVNTVSSVLRNDVLENRASYGTNKSFTVALRGNLPSKYQETFDDVFHPHVINSQEQHFILGSHYGVSNRAPYMNLGLLELCMAIPNTVKYGDGRGRAHLREAMKGILIESVRTRSTKSSLSSPDGHDMTVRLYQQSQDYLMDSSIVWDFIDRKKFNTQVSILFNSKVPYLQKSRTYFHITRTISLSIWLDWVKRNVTT